MSDKDKGSERESIPASPKKKARLEAAADVVAVVDEVPVAAPPVGVPQCVHTWHRIFDIFINKWCTL